MAALLPDIDPDGLMEYSVVFTDRSLNHMSGSFQSVMKDISSTLKQVYNAQTAVVIPGSGTFAMEAVARHFATGKSCLVIRNGWFSFRWTQIFEMGDIPSKSTVLKARPVGNGKHSAYIPAPIEEVTAAIKKEKPDVVFAPHVETSSGMILPDEYIRAVADAAHGVGGLFVLDCVASGTIWVDMEQQGVDVLISAPQKGWSSSPCCGLVMLNSSARELMESLTSTSYSCDLLKWFQIMQAYEKGGHAYHATMPTDSLKRFRDAIKETEGYGFDKVKANQQKLGDEVVALLKSKGISCVAADGYQAPGVIVCYTEEANIQNGKRFADAGIQIAAGVPLRCDEPEDFQTYRIGLFGLDKLYDIDRTIKTLDGALSQIYG